MNPGIAQGFIKFDSLACQILRAYLEFGPMNHSDLMDVLGHDARHVSTVVGRLQLHGFIWKQDRACKYDTGLAKTQWIFGLTPHESRHFNTRKRTVAERQARYRAKVVRQRANSIFNLGATQLNVQVQS